MRMIPLPEQNLVAVSFATPTVPDLDVHLKMGPAGASIGNWIQPQAAAHISRLFTEPRRMIAPLFVTLPAKREKFSSAIMDLTVFDINFPACTEQQVVVHAQLSKVWPCFT